MIISRTLEQENLAINECYKRVNELKASIDIVVEIIADKIKTETENRLQHLRRESKLIAKEIKD